MQKFNPSDNKYGGDPTGVLDSTAAVFHAMQDQQEAGGGILDLHDGLYSEIAQVDANGHTVTKYGGQYGLGAALWYAACNNLELMGGGPGTGLKLAAMPTACANGQRSFTQLGFGMRDTLTNYPATKTLPRSHGIWLHDLDIWVDDAVANGAQIGIFGALSQLAGTSVSGNLTFFNCDDVCVENVNFKNVFGHHAGLVCQLFTDNIHLSNLYFESHITPGANGSYQPDAGAILVDGGTHMIADSIETNHTRGGIFGFLNGDNFHDCTNAKITNLKMTNWYGAAIGWNGLDLSVTNVQAKTDRGSAVFLDIAGKQGWDVGSVYIENGSFEFDHPTLHSGVFARAWADVASSQPGAIHGITLNKCTAIKLSNMYWGSGAVTGINGIDLVRNGAGDHVQNGAIAMREIVG